MDFVIGKKKELYASRSYDTILLLETKTFQSKRIELATLERGIRLM